MGMEAFVYERMEEIQDRHWWYEARRRILKTVLSRLPLPAGAKILEAGSGTGANLKMLGSLGNVVGFEPFTPAREKAIKTTGCRIEEGYLPGPIPYEGPFDLVCAFDVIEHVEQDAASLKALAGLTTPGGYGVFCVPAFKFLWSQHDVANHHFRRYTRPEFNALLKAAGYEVKYISYFNTFLFPVVLAVRTLKNALKLNDKPDEKMPRFDWLNRVLMGVFGAERHFVGRLGFPFGVSIIAICQKPPSRLN